jgi:hypothetical protein
LKPNQKSRDSVLHSRSTSVERLHRLTVYGRWFTAIALWLSVGILSLWTMRRDIDLWFENFTWVSVLYALVAHPIAAFGLCICIAMTLSVLVWQSRNILWGLSRQEELRLVRQVRKIRATGPRHLLWKWVIKKSYSSRGWMSGH